MNRILVLLSSKDYKIAKKVLREGDMIISSRDYNLPLGIKNINIASIELSDRKLVEDIKLIFNELEKVYPNIESFINNFYDCSLSVLAKYILAIDQAVGKHKKKNVIFVKKVRFSPKTLNYFLSEYESQGIRLYSREDVFTYFLFKYCKALGIKYVFLNNKLGIQPLYNFMRLYLVFLYRFLIDLGNSKLRISRQCKRSINYNPDFIFSIRTLNQYGFIEKIISDNNYKHLVIVSHSTVRKKDLTRILKMKLKNVKIIKASHPLLLEVITFYLKTILRIFFFKRRDFRFKKILIDLSQAIKEVLVMLPHIEIYESCLSRTFTRLNTKSAKVFITLEQKSPHALIDSKVSRKFLIKPIQLMYVDQENRILPRPITGDRYFVDFKIREKVLRNLWKSNKVKFIGNPRLIDNELFDGNNEFFACFFASLHDYASNVRTIRILSEYGKKKKTKFIIKLHPRDFNNYNNPAPNYIKFFNNKYLADDSFYKSFSIAISHPSAVIYDLILKGKPLIYFKLNLVGTAFLEDYIPSISENDKIFYWLTNQTQLRKHFSLLQKKLTLGIKCIRNEDFLKNLCS